MNLKNFGRRRWSYPNSVVAVFIDRVANYRALDENGAATKGKFALWFEEVFRALTDVHFEIPEDWALVLKRD
ncbi:MAG: hypothetical protein V2A56_13605 [bacterium]